MDINNIENLENETIFLTKKTSEIGVKKVKEEKKCRPELGKAKKCQR